jgi:hypothetical protein
MRYGPFPSVIAVVLAMAMAAACAASPATQSPEVTSSAEPASASASAASPSAEPTAIVDRFRANVTDPEARWVADIDGWFITSLKEVDDEVPDIRHGPVDDRVDLDPQDGAASVP